MSYQEPFSEYLVRHAHFGISGGETGEFWGNFVRHLGSAVWYTLICSQVFPQLFQIPFSKALLLGFLWYLVPALSYSYTLLVYVVSFCLVFGLQHSLFRSREFSGVVVGIFLVWFPTLLPARLVIAAFFFGETLAVNYGLLWLSHGTVFLSTKERKTILAYALFIATINTLCLTLSPLSWSTAISLWALCLIYITSTVWNQWETMIQGLEYLTNNRLQRDWPEMVLLPLALEHISLVHHLTRFGYAINNVERDDVTWAFTTTLLSSCIITLTKCIIFTQWVSGTISCIMCIAIMYMFQKGITGTRPPSLSNILIGHKLGFFLCLNVEYISADTMLGIPMSTPFMMMASRAATLLVVLCLCCAYMVYRAVTYPLAWRLAFVRYAHAVKSASAPTLYINVRRNNVLDDTLRALTQCEPNQQYAPWKVNFVGEVGQDVNGLTKGWLRLLVKQLSRTETQLFTCNPSGRLFIHPLSVYLNPDRGTMRYLVNSHGGVTPVFRLLGIVLGKCIVSNTQCGLDLCSAVLKYIIDPSGTLTVEDLQDFDPELSKRLQSVPLHQIGDLGLTFSADVQNHWNTTDTEEAVDTQSVPLVPGGSEMEVTADNFSIYLNLLSSFYLKEKCEQQLQALREGILTVIPSYCFSQEFCVPALLTFDDLRAIFNTGTDLTLEDWKFSTVYANKSSDADDVKLLVAFWRCVGELDREQQCQLFRWVTELDRLPAGGCCNVVPRFTINIVDRKDPPQLLQAHTCFNTLDLPRYKDEEELREFMGKVLEMAGEAYAIM